MMVLPPHVLMHYELAERIMACKDEEERIRLCELDVSIAEDFKLEYLGMYDYLPGYSSFAKLAIYYEKAGDYDRAIEVCKNAKALGFRIDRTKGGIDGRIARLEKKMGKTHGA